MRLGILGDIHGNLPALKAVLHAARLNNVERLLINGDFVGYYFWPSQVLDELTEWKLSAVRGNHEDMLIQSQNNSDCLLRVNKKYGTGIQIALETLSSNQLDWLKNLPHQLNLTFDDHSLLLCHGSPWSVDEYVYPNSSDETFARCAEGAHTWVVMGHTHYPFIRKTGNTTLINPGSVGQPRNKVPMAHWACLDTETQTVTLKTESYDATEVIQKARQLHPEIPYLANVLERIC